MWISFDEIIEKHDLAPFQIVDAFKAGLHPYHVESGEALTCEIDWDTAPTAGRVRGQPWHLVLIAWDFCRERKTWKQHHGYIIHCLRDPLVAWRKVDVDDYIKGQEKTPVSTVDVDYSRKSKAEQAKIAKSWLEQGLSRRQVAQKLYSHDLDNFPIGTLMKRVDRL